MDQLFRPLLAAGLVIAGLGAATAVSIFEKDGRTISVRDRNDDDLVDEEALDGLTLRTAAPNPAPSAAPARRIAPKAAPVSEPVSGPRAPREPGDGAQDSGGTNPPGSGDEAVGVGPDINDGQGLPANPAD